MRKFAVILLLLMPLGCKLKKSKQGLSNCWPVADGSNRIFTLTGPFQATVGECAGPFTIATFSEVPGEQCTGGKRTEARAGEPWPVTQDTTIYLSMDHNAGTFFTDAACQTANDRPILALGSNSTMFYFKYYQIDFSGNRTTAILNVDAGPEGIGPAHTNLTVFAPN